MVCTTVPAKATDGLGRIYHVSCENLSAKISRCFLRLSTLKWASPSLTATSGILPEAHAGTSSKSTVRFLPRVCFVLKVLGAEMESMAASSNPLCTHATSRHPPPPCHGEKFYNNGAIWRRAVEAINFYIRAVLEPTWWYLYLTIHPSDIIHLTSLSSRSHYFRLFWFTGRGLRT